MREGSVLEKGCARERHYQLIRSFIQNENRVPDLPLKPVIRPLDEVGVAGEQRLGGQSDRT
jgi:hypothetical protein